MNFLANLGVEDWLAFATACLVAYAVVSRRG